MNPHILVGGEDQEVSTIPYLKGLTDEQEGQCACLGCAVLAGKNFHREVGVWLRPEEWFSMW